MSFGRSWAASSTSVLIAARRVFKLVRELALSCSMSRARARARSTISSRARASWAALSPDLPGNEIST